MAATSWTNEDFHALVAELNAVGNGIGTSDLQASLSVVSRLLFILACLAVLQISNAAVWPLVFVCVGVMQYHLTVAVHEASHFGLFKSKGLNKATGTLLSAMLGFDYNVNRTHHAEHHRKYGTPADPDWREYVLEETVRGPLGLVSFILARRTLLVAVGQLVRKYFYPGQSKLARSETVNVTGIAWVLVCQVAIFAGFATLGQWWWYLVFWVAPLSVFPKLLNGLRMFGEHAGLERFGPQGGKRIFAARTTHADGASPLAVYAALERFVLAPFNFNSHHEHHIAPQVPYQALPALHRHLKASGHYERHPENLSPHYLATMRAETGQPQEGIAAPRSR